MDSALHPADTFFGSALSFLCGVFWVAVGWPLNTLLIVAAPCVSAVLFLRKALWRICFLFFATLVLGVFYHNLFLKIEEVGRKLPPNGNITFSGVVVDEPQITDKSRMLKVALQPPFAGNVTVFTPQESRYEYGDLVSVAGSIEPPADGFENPALFPKKISLVSKHMGFWLREIMIDLKLEILARFNELLPGDEATLLGGITLGARTSFGSELKNAMALSGTTHLVAVSGYNITIIVIAVENLFRKYLSRRATLIAIGVVLVLFVFMVGAQISAIRAAFMGFLALTARELGEVFSMRNAILFTATLMSILDPGSIIAPSFTLSFLSLLGVIYLSPAIKKFIRRADKNDDQLPGWKENIIITISAQLAVMPILLANFGQFSVVAIVANTLILATIPLTMFLGALLGLLSFISKFLAFFTAKLTGFFLTYQLFIIRFFAHIATPVKLAITPGLMIGFYYLILAIFIYSYGKTDRGDREI